MRAINPFDKRMALYRSEYADDSDDVDIEVEVEDTRVRRGVINVLENGRKSLRKAKKDHTADAFVCEVDCRCRAYFDDDEEKVG